MAGFGPPLGHRENCRVHTHRTTHPAVCCFRFQGLLLSLFHPASPAGSAHGVKLNPALQHVYTNNRALTATTWPQPCMHVAPSTDNVHALGWRPWLRTCTGSAPAEPTSASPLEGHPPTAAGPPTWRAFPRDRGRSHSRPSATSIPQHTPPPRAAPLEKLEIKHLPCCRDLPCCRTLVLKT